MKLRHLEQWNLARWNAASSYVKQLASLGPDRLLLPDLAAPDGHVFHLFVVRTESRDALAEHLRTRGIATVIHYPRPYFLEPAFEGLARPGQFPESEAAARTVLSLPLFPEITAEQIDSVVSAIKDFFN